jgi:hypothetical protein
MAAMEIKEVSILEGGAADELAHDGGRWDFLVADGDEVVDKLQKTMGLAVFRTVFWHRSEDRLGMVAKHGKLNVEGRIKHHVCCLLVGENPLHLTFTDRRPLGDSLLCSECTDIIIADDATQ